MKRHQTIPTQVTADAATFECLCGHKRVLHFSTGKLETLAAGDSDALHSGVVASDGRMLGVDGWIERG